MSNDSRIKLQINLFGGLSITYEGKDVSIPLSSVNKAKLVLTDELVQQFLKKNK